MIGMLRRWLGRREARGLHPRDPALAGWFGAAEAASGIVVTPDTAMRATAVARFCFRKRCCICGA